MNSKHVLASYMHLPGQLHVVPSNLSDLLVNEVLILANLFSCYNFCIKKKSFYLLLEESQ